MEHKAFEALRLAQVNEHLGEMHTSAQLCAQDAEKYFNVGNFELAYTWALRSLRYSVGIFGADYRKALTL